MKSTIPMLMAILALFLAACNLTGALAGTAAPVPSEQPDPGTVVPLPSAEPTDDAAPTPSSMPIVYFYFVPIAGNTFPAGSVVIVPDVLILGPTLSDISRSPDAATNIGSALQAMIDDPRSAWTSDDLAIASIAFDEGHVDVALQGTISGAGDVVLIAARMQILMTVFAEPAVQTATVTLNGESIGNLGISHSSEAKPADYQYTRTEIETFMAENAYNN